MHKKIPNEEFEEDNDHSILPINHSTLENTKKQTFDPKRNSKNELFENKRLFDIEPDTLDNRESFEIKQRCLTEESKDSRSFQKHESLKSDKITKIEDIEKIAHLFKFNDNIKEIKIKQKDNTNLDNIDFSSIYHKGDKLFLENKDSIFKVVKESNKTKSFLKMFTSNSTRFLIINNGNIIHLIKNPSKPKELYTVKSQFCLNKLFQIILDQKQKMTVRLFFFNEQFDPRIPPIHKKFKFESSEKKNEFLRWIKTELEIKQQEMIFN